MGSKPNVRVGGNTQDYALYNASLKTGLNGTYNASKSNDYPTTLYMGESFFESYRTWPGVKFSHGFNLARGAISAAGWDTLIKTAPLACEALSHGNFDAMEYGNEPNNYPTSAQGITRPQTWHDEQYTAEWLNGTRAILEQVKKHCPKLAQLHALFMAPSYDDRVSNLNATKVWADGLDNSGTIKLYSVHK